MLFKVRAAQPEVTEWKEIEAFSHEEAAMAFHEKHNPPTIYIRKLTDEGDGIERLEHVHFCLVEIDGFGELISRFFHTGIWRRGGAKGWREKTAREAAKILGWDADPQELLSPGWDLEEEYKRYA